MAVRWDLDRDGRAWEAEDFESRLELLPEKLEVYRGKMLWHENHRINLLGLLLEQVGVDAAVRLGRLEIWEAAIARCRGEPRELFARPPGWTETG